MEASYTGHRHEPWNKGKLVGQKAPFKFKEIWAIRVGLQMQQRRGSWPCSTWVSTASCALATWSVYEYTTCATAIV
jgi:hypothetical protein